MTDTHFLAALGHISQVNLCTLDVEWVDADALTFVEVGVERIDS